MGLKLIVEKLDDIPEALRDLYSLDEKGDKKYHLNVEGLEDTSALKSAAKKERERADAAEKIAKQFDGLNAEEVRALMQRFENDEELQLIRKGETAKLRDRWTEKMRADHEKQMKAKQAEIDAAIQTGKKWSDRVLDNAVRAAASTAQMHPGGVEDALLRARNIFTLDAEGNAIQMRDGAVVVGKDGQTPFSPREWLESMREIAPHWFLAPAGGSGAPAQGNRSAAGSNGQKQMRRSAFDQLPPMERMKFSVEGGTVID